MGTNIFNVLTKAPINRKWRRSAKSMSIAMALTSMVQETDSKSWP